MLSNIYKNNTDFRTDIKMIMSFSFLPTEMIEIAANEFDKYIIEKEYYSEILVIWKWFKAFYLKDFSNSKDSIFNYVFWSSYDRIKNSSPITTNAIEGWHRTLNFNIRVSHPSITVLIEELLKEQNKVEFKILKVLHSYIDNNGNFFQSFLNSEI
ncbi:hypothetical protein DMUE_0919 [Dictyocoela muelleri]|nr:hypothetical protein DMUE_0919 [Dictyocoela muelleri]